MRRIIPLIAILAVACSSGGPVDPGPDLQLTPPGEVVLAEGQSVEVSNPGGGPLSLRVTFAEVQGDSRCPDLAQCIWAGDAAIRLEFSGLASGNLVLHTPTEELGPRSGEAGPFGIELIGLSKPSIPPAPRPHQEQYRATLRFTALP